MRSVRLIKLISNAGYFFPSHFSNHFFTNAVVSAWDECVQFSHSCGQGMGYVPIRSAVRFGDGENLIDTVMKVKFACVMRGS